MTNLRTAVLLVSLATVLAQSPSPESSLAGTSWRLVEFRGGDGKVLRPDDPNKYTVAFGKDGRVAVRIDCNRGSGTWKSPSANQLTFGPLALTRMACLNASLYDRVAKDWDYVRSYTRKDGHLFLSLMADAGIYEYEPLNAPTESTVASKGPFIFDCKQAEKAAGTLKVTFYETKPGLALLERSNQTRPAFQVRAASGAKYEGAGVLFWEAHGEAAVTWLGVDLKCKPRR